MISKTSIKRITVFTILITLLFSIPYDPDLGWHYKYGEFFWNHGYLLTQNIFSYTNTNYKWLNTYWLYEIVMYPLYKWAGLILPSLIATIITAVFFYKKILVKAELFETKVIVSILFSTMLTFYAITVRPHFLSTIFMFLLVSWLLYEKKQLKWAPLLFIIWANWHADFVLGLFIYGIAVATDVLKYIFQSREQKNFRIVYLEMGLFLITLAVTLINPYGINLWLTLTKELTLPAKSFVNEWANPLVLDDLSTTTFFILSGIISCVSILINKKRYPVWYLPMVIFFFIFSLRSIYMGRILAILGLFPLIDLTDTLVFNYYEHITNETKVKERVITKIILNGALSLILFSCVGILLFKLVNSANVRNVSEYAKQPYDAVQYIKDNKLQGNMLNEYNWGGYLIWRLPEYKTYIDGRMTSWRENGKYFTQEYFNIKKKPEQNRGYLEEQITLNNIGFALLTNKSKLATYLETDMKWKEIYKDTNSVILIKPED